jgi:hypothetical protein
MVDNTDIKIFVSYRRDDARCFAERIRDWFMMAYERENVFMDFDAIPPFVRFEDFIIEQIKKVDVMLVIIGPNWLDILKERMARPDEVDYVRLEIRMGLEMGKLVAPILVDGAAAPDPDDLPPEIRPIMQANAPRLDGGRQFLDNIERLVNALPVALAQHIRLQSADEAARVIDPMRVMRFAPAMTLSDDDAPPAESADRTLLICAAADDLLVASRLQDDLRAAELETEIKIVAGPIQEIKNTVDLILFILSPHSKGHPDLIEQIKHAQHTTTPALPVLVAGEPGHAAPYSLSLNQMIDLRDYDAQINDAIDRIKQYI